MAEQLEFDFANHPMRIKNLQKASYDMTVDKGFWERTLRPDTQEQFPNALEKLMLISCEVAEAAEDYRKCKYLSDLKQIHIDPKDGKVTGFPSELADIILRTVDLAERFGIDLEDAIAKKMAYNKTRGYKHGKNS